MTLARLERLSEGVPPSIAWSLAAIAETKGRQDLYTRQSPQWLKELREHAIIESAISSNRMEGVQIEPGRVRTVVFGHSLLRDRDEEEVRGYREALALIYTRDATRSIMEEEVLRLHRLCRGGIGMRERTRSGMEISSRRMPTGG
jgi:hypothetical protein